MDQGLAAAAAGEKPPVEKSAPPKPRRTKRKGAGQRKTEKKAEGPTARAERRRQEKQIEGEDNCFVCKDGGEVVFCDFKGCSKVYHPDCVGLSADSLPERFTCPAHACSKCERGQPAAEAALPPGWRCCRTCPSLYCKACLPSELPHYGPGSVICLGCYRYIRRLEDIGLAPDQDSLDPDNGSSYEHRLHLYWNHVKAENGLLKIGKKHKKRLDKLLIEGASVAGLSAQLPPPRITQGTTLGYEWEGKGRRKYSGTTSSGREETRRERQRLSTFYDAFSRSTRGLAGGRPEVFKIGDCVLLTSDESHTETLLGEIRDLFEDFLGSMWVRLVWFYYPTERGVPEHALSSAEGGPVLPGEVFISNHMDDVEICCIQSKVTVLKSIVEVGGDQPRQPPPAAEGHPGGEGGLRCWRSYDTTRQRVQILTASNAESELNRGREGGNGSGSGADEEHGRQTGQTGAEQGKQKRKRGTLYDEVDLEAEEGGWDRQHPAGTHSFVLPQSTLDDHTAGTPAGVAGDDKASCFARAREALRPGALPAFMPCREVERGEITSFLRQSIQVGGVGRGLYISGVPGTGKTATVYEVVRGLKAEAASRSLPPFRFVEINGMSLPDPSYAFSVLHEELTGRYTTPQRAADQLEKHFTTYSEQRSPFVLLLDEVDLLVTRKQNVLYKLLDWPTYPYARLIVIAIANTMDLPERLLPRLGSRLGLQRVSFKPYDVKQIEQIVSARLRGVDAFDSDAVEFCARKVAAVSGDVRRALEICRRAAEIGEERILTAAAAAAGPQHGWSKKVVSMNDVLAAVKNMATASNMQHIQSLPLHARLCLCILANEAQRDEVGNLDFLTLARRHRNVCEQIATEYSSNQEKERERSPPAPAPAAVSRSAIDEYIMGGLAAPDGLNPTVVARSNLGCLRFVQTDGDSSTMVEDEAGGTAVQISTDALATVCHRLAACRLVLAGHPKAGPLQVLQLNIPPDDVHLSLRADPSCMRVLRGSNYD